MTSCLSTWPDRSTIQETRQPTSSSPRKTVEGKEPKSESTTSVMTAWTISSHESSCLPNYRPLNVSPRLFLGFLQSAQEACVRACSQCHDWRPRTSHCFSLKRWTGVKSLPPTSRDRQVNRMGLICLLQDDRENYISLLHRTTIPTYMQRLHPHQHAALQNSFKLIMTRLT